MLLYLQPCYHIFSFGGKPRYFNIRWGCPSMFILPSLYISLPLLLMLISVQKAAGCISFLNTLESLQDFRSVSQMDSEVVLEFSEQLLIGLQQLMVAQAQQSTWRKAVMSTNFLYNSFALTSITLLTGGLKGKLVVEAGYESFTHFPASSK